VKRRAERWEVLFLTVLFAAGLALRLRLALTTYLNPDEALEALIAFERGWRHTFRVALTIPHPPLLLMMVHAISFLGRSEMVVRILPVLAGSLFPLAVYLWLRRIAGNIAGLFAALLLTFAPHLIGLSAELRSYTLALFFIAASLAVFEEAISTASRGWMWIFNLLLWAAILSDYTAACFACAMGVYALLRLGKSPRALKIDWAAGQAISIAMYGLLFWFQVRRIESYGMGAEARNGWLSAEFPHRATALLFPFRNTVDEFRFLMASATLGAMACFLFFAALWLLWTGRTRIDISISRAIAALLILPFLFGIAEAYAGVFPYGGSRHTAIIIMFAAMGVAITLGSLPRRMGIASLCAAVLLAPLWMVYAEPENNIDPTRNRKELLHQCLDYMHAAIPSGATIFTEQETLLIVAFYEGSGVPLRDYSRYLENSIGGWRVVVHDYDYTTYDQFAQALAAFRADYGLRDGDPVWVLDGGWYTVSRPPDPARPFTRAVRVFQSFRAHDDFEARQ